MLDTSVLPGHLYNTVTTRRDIPSEDTLLGIARIFQQHNIESHVGMCVVHRHFELDDNEVMLHDGLRCAPAQHEDLDKSQLDGKAFFLQDKKWQAYEYCMGQPLNLSAEFLTELREYMVANGTQDALALVRLREEHELLVEYEIPSMKACICEVGSSADLNPTEVTTWGFDVMKGGFQPRQACHSVGDKHEVK